MHLCMQLNIPLVFYLQYICAVVSLFKKKKFELSYSFWIFWYISEIKETYMFSLSLKYYNSYTFQIRLVLACILSPILIVLGVLIAKLYNDSGKLIFRTVGANTEQQAMCKTMFAFFGLLKFDLQLGVGIILLFLHNIYVLYS